MLYLAFGIALLAGCAAVGTVLYTRRRTRTMLQRMNAMLDAAIQGDFHEQDFDESLLSALETRLAQYLSSCALSSRQLAEEKNKLKELIGDISHQTKTPIANLLLYTQLLQEQPLNAQSKALVSSAEAQAEKLRFLIEALVKISRLEAGVLAIVPKAGAVQGMLEKAVVQAGPAATAKGIALTLASTDCTACFDAKWTAEAVYNLLDNAVKYTPAGGRVSVCASAYELFCRIDVADTGPGIPEEEQAKIFGRFYRSPAVHDAAGVGIGLYLVRQIAAGQGGYVKVSSTPGQGSVFSLYLPREK